MYRHKWVWRVLKITLLHQVLRCPDMNWHNSSKFELTKTDIMMLLTRTFSQERICYYSYKVTLRLSKICFHVQSCIPFKWKFVVAYMATLNNFYLPGSTILNVVN